MAGGFDGTSMEDVARAAGVTRLILYRIFDSKEDLYLAVLLSVIDDVVNTFDFPAPVVVPETGNAVVLRVLQVARRQPDGFRLLWRHASHEPKFATVAARFKSGSTAYTMAMLEAIMPDSPMLDWAANALISHVYDSVCHWIDGGDETQEAVFVQMMTAGVRSMVREWAAVSRRQ